MANHSQYLILKYLRMMTLLTNGVKVEEVDILPQNMICDKLNIIIEFIIKSFPKLFINHKFLDENAEKNKTGNF